MAEQLNKNEIIDSGMLELYVAGALSEEESSRISQFVKESPELQQEVIEIEKTLMHLAAANVEQRPKVNTIYQVLNKIEEEKTKESQSETPIVDFFDKQEKRDMRWLQIAAAVALLLSIAVNIFLYLRLNNVQGDVKYLQAELEKNQKSSQNLLAVNKSQSEFIDLVSKETVYRIDLERIAREESNKAFVIYDEASKKLAISKWSLAELEEEQVYQLWAIYGEDVVSLGALPQNPQKVVFKDLENIKTPDAFAISFEPDGESPTPTEVIMVGAVNV